MISSSRCSSASRRCPRSPRPSDAERPTVSTPITWDELEEAFESERPEQLVFEAEDVLARAERHGDLFKPVLALKQSLPALATA